MMTREEVARILHPDTSREALRPYDWDPWARHHVVEEACRLAAEMLTAEMLTADARTAEWVEDQYGYYHCSACGWEWDDRETVTPYCPHCGAHMEAGL